MTERFTSLVITAQILKRLFSNMHISFLQIRSVTQSCPTLCDPMNRSTPGLPVHHQLLEFTQTHVHQVSDAIQPSLILCRPLLLLPPIPPSIRVFSNESTLRMRWRFLKKLEIKAQYDPAMLLLGIYPEETKIERDTCIPLFISALFAISRTWKQPR